MNAKEFTPMNANERLLHAIVLRQDVLIEQMSSLIQHFANKDGIAVTEEKVEVAKPKRTRKTTPKEGE